VITQTTALWYASRATGVVSLVMLSLVMLLGILVNRQGRLPGLPSFAVTGLHRSLSLLSVAFVSAHVAAAIADPYVTIRLVSAVVPFTSGYQPFWLGLGAVALDLVLALIVTSLIRGRLSRRAWRGMHWLAYAAWPVAFAHGLGASPDLRAGGLRALAAAVGSSHRGSREDEFEQVRKWLEDCLADIAPQRGYLAAIRSVLPDDGVFVSEFTQVGYAASVCFPVYHPRGYIGPGYQGTLGYGFATALGAKAADPSRAVISVTGDGGFSWTMQELSTLRRYGLGMVTVVFNDGYFGNVRRIQKNRYGGRYFASDLTNPDYQQLAGAFGIGFACARDPDSLAGVLRDAVTASEPVLVEVPVGEFPSPWHLIHEGIPRPAPIAPGAHLPTERRHA